MGICVFRKKKNREVVEARILKTGVRVLNENYVTASFLFRKKIGVGILTVRIRGKNGYMA